MKKRIESASCARARSLFLFVSSILVRCLSVSLCFALAVCLPVSQFAASLSRCDTRARARALSFSLSLFLSLSPSLISLSHSCPLSFSLPRSLSQSCRLEAAYVGTLGCVCLSTHTHTYLRVHTHTHPYKSPCICVSSYTHIQRHTLIMKRYTQSRSLTPCCNVLQRLCCRVLQCVCRRVLQ